MGPYSANWTNITRLYKTPEWYKDAKFGFYTHWLVSSVPAFGSEWYPRNMYVPGSDENKHQIETYGPLSPTNGFKEFIPSFTGESFDPREWMEIFQRAGAVFAGPVGEHHDGFPMYNCSLTPYTAVKMGPKRDVAMELLQASKLLSHKMYFIMSSHRAWHFAFYNNGRKWPNSDVAQCACPTWQEKADEQTPNADPIYCDLYCPANPNETTPTDAFMLDWLLRTCEMADIYTPDVFYFDWWIGVSPVWQPYLQKMTAFYYNRLLMDGKVGVINTKGTTMPTGADVLDFERGQACSVQKHYWQTDTSISVYSWGYIENDLYKTAPGIVTSFVDIVSKNGGMLLNVGPPPNGTIPAAAVDTFKTMGDWLAVVGVSIYGSRPHHVFGEGPTQVACGSFTDTSQNFTIADFRFTVNPGTSILYVVCMGAGARDSLTVKLLGAGRLGLGSISDVSVLGGGAGFSWTVDAVGLHVTLPSQLKTPPGLPPVLAVRGLTDILWDGIVRQGQDGSINLYASLVDVLTGNVSLDVAGQYLTVSNWKSTHDSVQWTVKVRAGGSFSVTILAACPGNIRTGTLSAQNQNIQFTFPQTYNATQFTGTTSGPLSLSASDSVIFYFQLTSMGDTTDPEGFQLAQVALTPA